TQAHEGQTRFDGSPYIEHPLRVMRTVENQGHSRRVQIVGVLHDTVEDSDWTFEMLREEGFDKSVIYPLELLTKDTPNRELSDEEKQFEYELYVQRLSVNACARAVKKADLFDNLDLTGLENPSKKRIMNIEKYGRAHMYLARFPQPRL
ncbi:hypothetical protein HY312_01020, partial [Candidatus Saccharibacteria bacterium]|nr:hypothetical protein [Candidatus Saccharibacteria bacterium]